MVTCLARNWTGVRLASSAMSSGSSNRAAVKLKVRGNSNQKSDSSLRYRTQ